MLNIHCDKKEGVPSDLNIDRKISLKNPKILVIAALWWPIAARISMALANSGCRVAAVTPPGSVIRKIKAIHAHYSYRPWAGLDSITRAIESWLPDFLICSDDQAVIDLQRLHLRASKARDDPQAARLIALIETSLGDPAGFLPARAKSEFMKCAQSARVRCPRTTIISNERALEVELLGATYPIVLKADGSRGGLADGSWGGLGVRIVRDNEEARKAFRELETPFTPFTWWKAIVRSIDGLTPQPLLDRTYKRRNVVALQEYIVGRCANRAIACWKGEILAGISAEAVETQVPPGHPP